jgi:CopA family copper-resistance protein
MHSTTRRRFVQQLTGGALLLGARGIASGAPGTALTGTQFDLTIDRLPVDYTGQRRFATAVNAQVPAPLLRMREGDIVTVRVTNRLSQRSSIHWHGLLVPADMDGVPGLSFPGIGPGETFVYRFAVNQSGTYWYHAHSRFQEQTGLYGAIVVEPRIGQRHHYDRDHVVLLADWTDVDPEHIYATLKRQSDYFDRHQRTAKDFFEGSGEDWAMWGRMRMDPTDLLDVSGATYSYLMNGLTAGSNWTGLYQRGERLRLRFINGSSMSFFDVRIPGLMLTVIAADGQDVEPVTVEEFRIAPAETLDVLVTPVDDSAYTVFAQAMDRSGYARGTLAPQIGMQASVPLLDTRAMLQKSDMGMQTSMRDMPGMADMHHLTPALTHARAERGPGVDMLVEQPRRQLDDPGVGLRANGRRVLTYADLHTLGGSIDERDPQREIALHLTGHMQRYMWSFDGEPFSRSEPLRFRYGERLRIVLINDTMMTHPIHLHGMWSELENEQGAFQVRKHTVTVQPAQRVSYRVSANAPGRWAYHCHLLYHMQAGMFREVSVA